ncbi:hypothetical protein SEA_CRICKO_82 [Streptomyces phage CricKo]|nr:hypothetical protein SEA_RAINYDAI_79 [Streptomyces phage Rainydai]QJD49965.1 hypothetical protein SEA_CRICKO_82 [Streptomyces phage CricKo]QNL30697.1 hypothetical protein SEA_THIQQUMS_82 [Streptomyces phage Thiqqums]
MLDTIYLDSGFLQGVIVTDTTSVVRSYITEKKLMGDLTRFSVHHGASDETLTIEQYMERTGEGS